MSKTIVWVFKVIATLTISLILWSLVVGGSLAQGSEYGVDIRNSVVQRAMWGAAYQYYDNTWNAYTGHDGATTEKIVQSVWDSAKSVE